MHSSTRLPFVRYGEDIRYIGDMMEQPINQKISEQPKGYFDAEVVKVEKNGVTIVLRGPYEMNGNRQPAAVEVIEGKKPVKILTKQGAAIIAELSRKKIYQEFSEQYLGEIQNLDTLEDATIS